MKKVIFALVLSFVFVGREVRALGVADIPEIDRVVNLLLQDVLKMKELSTELMKLKDTEPPFTYTVAGTTQSVSLTNANKLGLIAHINNIKADMVNHFNQFPQ